MSNSEIVQLFLVIVGLAFVAFEVITNMNDVADDTTNIILYQATLKKCYSFHLPLALLQVIYFWALHQKYFHLIKSLPFR
jgi:hypothetical protein